MMNASDALSDQELKTRFIQAYHKAFDVIAANKDGHFSPREVTLARKIYPSCWYDVREGHENVFHVAVDNKNAAIFTASYDAIAHFLPVLEFCAAHEIKHASLILGDRLHDTNIRSWQKGLKKVLAFAPDASYYAQQTLGSHRMALMENSALITAPVFAVAFGWDLAKELIISPLSYALSRKEENTCDAFALKVFPNTDINVFHSKLSAPEDHNTLHYAFVTPEGDFMAGKEVLDIPLPPQTHPHRDKRLERLRKLQRKLIP